jgi:Virulence-associated protein E/Bifunctional DNA primase/polymerase, N-terminal
MMATVLEVRQALIDRGYVPIPVNGKIPPFKRWQKVDNVSSAMLNAWSKNWPAATNTGILTRLTPVIDLDILDEAAAIAAQEFIRERFKERGYFLVRVGRAPKRAILFRTLEPFKKLTTDFVVPAGAEAEKIEFLCDGQQVVAHGIHPNTGKPYDWTGGDPTQIAHDDLPYISTAEAQALQEDVVTLLCRDFGYITAQGRPNRAGNDAPLVAAQDWAELTARIHNNQRLHDSLRDLAAKLIKSGMKGGAAVNFLRAQMESTIAPRDDRWQDRYDNIPRLVESAERKFKRDDETASPGPIALPSAGGGSSGPPPGTGPTPSVGAGPSPGQAPAKQPYMRGRSAWACNVGNAVLALQQEPELIGAFGYDQMLCCDVLLRPLFKPDPNFTPRPVTDTDIFAVQERLQWLGFRRLGSNTTHDAISKHAREHAFHPVREYLDGLAWDGKDRLRTWLTSCFEAEDNEYTNEIGKMFLISMVARIYQPGCKVDYMMVLEGEQGLLKSSACNILANGYFSDQLPDILSKEAFQHLRGKWLIEVAELHNYKRADIDHFKAFLTRQIERYRPPWGRKEVHEPRQCVFIGTTNKALYLRDVTGNRRSWPLRTGDIDLDWLRDNRDQLFAEAVNLYRGGVRWWPGRDFERQTIRDEQEARYESDAWEEPIQRYLDGLTIPKKTTILEIALNALGYEDKPPVVTPYQAHPVRGTPINRLSPSDQHRIAAILTHLGWTPKRTKKERWWEPIDE